MFLKLISVLTGSIFSSLLLAAHDAQLTIPQGVLVSSGINVHFVAQFALFLSFVLLWTVAWGKLLYRICYLPTIAGQIIGGILLGPSLVNCAHISIFSKPLECIDSATGQLYALASTDLFIFVILLISSTLTVSYLLWIAGHETDIQDILKVGVTATTAGVLGAVLPIIMTTGALYLILSSYFSVAQAVGLGLVFSATSVSIPVAMLFSRNQMHLKSSKATLGAAIIDDILAVILLSLFFMALQSGMFACDMQSMALEQCGSLSQSLLYMAFSFIAMGVAGYFIVSRAVKFLSIKTRSYLITPVASGIMLIYFAFAELVGGLAGITGAYFAGLFHRMGDSKHVAEKAISPYVNSILLPLFLGSIGLQIDVTLLHLNDWAIVMLLLVVAIVSKLLACYISAALANIGATGSNRWSMVECYLFGSAMVARGEVGLVVCSILNGTKLISPQQYVIAIVVIVLSTIASPIMLAHGFALLRKSKNKDEEHDYRINIGSYSTLGNSQLFAIIIAQLEQAHMLKTAVALSEGNRIIDLEEHNVNIALMPEGIIFEGNRRTIEEIIKLVQKAVMADASKLAEIEPR